MWEKSKYRRSQTSFFGIIYEAFKYFSVTDVNTVKSANGYSSKVLFIVIGNALNCDHTNKIIKRLTFKSLKIP